MADDIYVRVRVLSSRLLFTAMWSFYAFVAEFLCSQNSIITRKLLSLSP